MCSTWRRVSSLVGVREDRRYTAPWSVMTAKFSSSRATCANAAQTDAWTLGVNTKCEIVITNYLQRTQRISGGGGYPTSTWSVLSKDTTNSSPPMKERTRLPASGAARSAMSRDLTSVNSSQNAIKHESLWNNSLCHSERGKKCPPFAIQGQMAQAAAATTWGNELGEGGERCNSNLRVLSLEQRPQ